MTLPVFTPSWSPSVGATNKPEVKVLRAEFGDGYTQATRDGMNNVRAVYEMRWDVLLPSEANDIISFFVACGGCDPFHYTIPEVTSVGKWTCESWSDQAISGGYRTVSATFRQSFT